MTEKQFEVQYDGWRYFHIVDTINERGIARLDTKADADAYLEIVEFYEELSEENEELKKENKELQITKNFWKEQCSHTTNEHKNHYSINHCRCTTDDFIHELKRGYKELQKENEELKQSIDNMCGKLQGLWAHYNTTRHGIWADAVEDVAKELGFKIDKR